MLRLVLDRHFVGILQPDRNWSAGRYRYGFNGKEMSNEIKGEGNLYTAEFWEYDPRVARRWNRDPKPIIGISEYSTFLGNPISLTDPKGDTVINGQTMEPMDAEHATQLSEVLVIGKGKPRKPMTNEYRGRFEKQVNRWQVKLMLYGLANVGHKLYGELDPTAILKLKEKDKQQVFQQNANKSLTILLSKFVEGTGLQIRQFDENAPITQEIKNSYTTSLFFAYFLPQYSEGRFDDGVERLHAVFTSPDNAGSIRKSFKAHTQVLWNSPAFLTGSLDYYFRISGKTLILRVHNQYSISSGVTRNKRDDLHRVPGYDSPSGNTDQYFNFTIDLSKLK